MYREKVRIFDADDCLAAGRFRSGSARFAADDLKPVVTVSFAGYDEVLANIETIGKLGGKPDLAKGLEGMLAIITQGKGLSGLDKKAPWGMVVHLSEQGQPAGFGFLPVSDLKQLMDIADELARRREHQGERRRV